MGAAAVVAVDTEVVVDIVETVDVTEVAVDIPAIVVVVVAAEAATTVENMDTCHVSALRVAEMIVAEEAEALATTVENLDTCHVSALRVAKMIGTEALLATTVRKLDILLAIVPRNVRAVEEVVIETNVNEFLLR